MKLNLLIAFIFFINLKSFGQDTISVTYSQELDTLDDQRFMDKYENIFMTKVPTRHLVKIGISRYYQALSYALTDDQAIFNNAFINAGYEFKFLPAFSIALSGHIPFANAGHNLHKSLDYAVFDSQLRWFFEMKKRVKSGNAASNFSGNYLALAYIIPGTFNIRPRAGIKLGFQRRFLNSGFMDFAVALQKSNFSGQFFRNLSFSTQASFGFAFGDWKKSKTAPLCEVLLCDLQDKDQWKILLPELTFGSELNRVRLGVGYERKLKNSPFSLNFQFNLGLSRGMDYLISTMSFRGNDYSERGSKLIHSTEFLPSFSFQPRYYILQNKQRITGKGSNGFSGLYAGLNSEYSYYYGKHSFRDMLTEIILSRNHSIAGGILVGFQQRLFNHGYLDLNSSYNYQNKIDNFSNSRTLKTNLGIGLAF